MLRATLIMVHHRTQKNGAGGGAGGIFKMDRIQLYLTGRSISIDLRGAQIPTPKLAAGVSVVVVKGVEKELLPPIDCKSRAGQGRTYRS